MKEKENTCPYCGGTTLEFGTIDWLNDDSIEQECHCETCNHYFTQIYNTTFDCQDYEYEDEEPEDANS